MAFTMKSHHLVYIHAIDMICAEHSNNIRPVYIQQIHTLIHGIGGAFETMTAFVQLWWHYRYELLRQ